MTILTALLNPNTVNQPPVSGAPQTDEAGAPFSEVLGRQRGAQHGSIAATQAKGRNAGAATDADDELQTSVSGLPEAVLPLLAQLEWRIDSHVASHDDDVSDASRTLVRSHRPDADPVATSLAIRGTAFANVTPAVVSAQPSITQVSSQVPVATQHGTMATSTDLAGDTLIKASSAAGLKTDPRLPGSTMRLPISAGATALGAQATMAETQDNAPPAAVALSTLTPSVMAEQHNPAPSAAPAVLTTADVTAVSPTATVNTPAATATGMPLSPGAGMALAPNHPGWPNHLGQQVLHLARLDSNQTHTAELRLDPPELGPLRITLSLQDGIAHAHFISPHLHVRQAVEQALPQLQQLLAQAGLSLGEANVGEQGGFEHEGGQRSTAGIRSASTPEETDTLAPRPLRQPANDALIDTFA